MRGWDEILEGGLSGDAAVMSWRGIKGGIEAAKKGHKVVMSPNDYNYIDYYQGELTAEGKVYRGLRMKTTYGFEPIPEGIDPNLILGNQANQWTSINQCFSLPRWQKLQSRELTVGGMAKHYCILNLKRRYDSINGLPI